MKRFTTILAALLLAVFQLSGAKYEPALDDWGAVRNFFYSDARRQLFYHIVTPEGSIMYRCANAQSEVVQRLPYGALLTIRWYEPDGWAKVSCPDYANSLVYHGYVRSDQLGRIEQVEVMNPKGARIEEYPADFHKRKKITSLKQGEQRGVSQEATDWGYIKIKYRWPDYKDVAVIRMADVKVTKCSPVVLKEKSLTSYHVRDGKPIPLVHPRRQLQDGEYVTVGWDTVAYLPPLTNVMPRDPSEQLKEHRNLVVIETYDTDSILYGMVEKKAIKAVDGTWFKRLTQNARGMFYGLSITKRTTDTHDKTIAKSKSFFKKQTNRPQAFGWDTYKWHLAGIIGWIVIAYILWIAMAFITNGWLELFFFIWAFVPPYWYIMSNPHSLWFSDPSCVGWTWAFFGYVFFVMLMVWFWTSVKRYCLSWNGANWFTSLVGVVYGWGCLYLIWNIFMATMSQELALLTITMVFTVFGKAPTPSPAQEGTLMEADGTIVHGHYEAGRFYGHNGGIYEPDPSSATGEWRRVN